MVQDFFGRKSKYFDPKMPKFYRSTKKHILHFFISPEIVEKKNFGPLLLKQIVLPFLLCNKELKKQFKEFFLQKNVFVLVDLICFSSQFCLYRLDQIKRQGSPFLFA